MLPRPKIFTIPLTEKQKSALKGLGELLPDDFADLIYRFGDQGRKVLLVSDHVGSVVSAGEIFAGTERSVFENILNYTLTQTEEKVSSLAFIAWPRAIIDRGRGNKEDLSKIGRGNAVFLGRLLYIIAKLKPDVVILCGAEPFKTIYHHFDMGRRWNYNMNRVLNGEAYGHKFQFLGTTDLFRPCSYDPKHRTFGGLIGWMVKGWRQAINGYNDYKVDVTDTKFHYIDTIDKFKTFFKRLESGKVIAMDTEGEGKGRISSKLYSLQFAFGPKEGYFLPFDHPATPWSPKERDYIKTKLRDYYERGTSTFHIWQFSKYDVGQLYANLDIRWYNHPIYDTISGRWAIDENLKGLRIYLPSKKNGKKAGGPMSLEYMTECDYSNTIYQDIEFSKGDRANIGAEGLTQRLIEYGIYDATIIFQICRFQIHEARKAGHKNFVNYITTQKSDKVKVLAQMEYVGAPINKQQIYKLASEEGPVARTIKLTQEKFRKSPQAQKVNDYLLSKRGRAAGDMFGGKKWLFDISKDECRQLLFFKAHKLEALEVRKDGGGKIDKAFIKKYMDTNTDVHTVAELTKAKIIRNNFVNVLLDKVQNDPDTLLDERVRSFYTYTGTDTGRLSCVAGHTKILTKRGYVRIDEITTQDYVWTHKERWRRVTHTIIKGYDQMYDIHLSNGHILTCTADHRIMDSQENFIRLGEILNVGWKTMGFKTSQLQRSSKNVQGQRVAVNDGYDSQTTQYDVAQCLVRYQQTYDQTRKRRDVQSTLRLKQKRRQQSNVWKDRWFTPQLDRTLRRQQRLLNLSTQRQTTICSQDSSGRNVRLKTLTFNIISTPHRWKQAQQRTRQFGNMYKFRSQKNSRNELSKIEIYITQVKYQNIRKVYDITVEDDHSYYACGIFSHNSVQPNLQNLPGKDDKTFSEAFSKELKSAFITKPFTIMEGADLSANEIRDWCNQSQDDVLANSFYQGMKMRREYRVHAYEYADELVSWIKFKTDHNWDGLKPKEVNGQVITVHAQKMRLLSTINDPNVQNFGTLELSLAIAGDLHYVNASVAFQVDVLDVTADQRYDIKAIVFGKIYGKIAASFAKSKAEGGLGYTEQECQAIMDRIFNKFVKGNNWLEEKQAFGLQNLFVESPLGMRRHLWGYLHTRMGFVNAMHRRGPNALIQGVGSEIGVTGVYLLQWLFWHFFLKHGVNIYWKSVNNIVHDAAYSLTPVPFLPVFLYLREMASTTLLHRYYAKKFNYNLIIGIEGESQLGASLNSLKKWDWTTRHLFELVESSLTYQKDKLGYQYTPKQYDRMMKGLKHNAQIIGDIRKEELKFELKNETRVARKMIVTEANARSFDFDYSLDLFGG